MSRLPLAQWDPSLFTELQHLLALVASQPTTSLVRRLFASLDTARPWILALTALPGPNEADKKAIAESPITTSEGVEVRVKDELLVTTNTIADNLNVSHLFAAILALNAVQERPRFPERSDAEIAVYILHEAQTALLDFVSELLRLTEGPDAEVGQPFDDLRIWVEDLLDEKGPNGYIADVAIDEIDAIHTRLDNLVRTQATGAALELVNFRVGSLRYEQNRLAGILGMLAQAGFLKASQVVKVVKWLKKCTRPDAVAATMLATFMASTPPIDTLSENDPRYETVAAYIQSPKQGIADPSAANKLLRVIVHQVFGEKWAVPPLQESARLHWSLFYLSAVRDNPALPPSVNLDADGAERKLQEAVAGGAFQFLTGLVVNLDNTPEDPTYALAQRSDPANNQFLYQQLDSLTFTLGTKRNFLRNLKNREEDVSLRRSQAPVANYQAYLALVAVVFKNLPPDSAEPFWDEPMFTGVVLDTRNPYPGVAFWDMLNAIANGPTCASKCYEKLKDTPYSYSHLIRMVDHYIKMMPHLYETIKRTDQVSLDPMAEDEFNLMDGWMRLLGTIVKGSALARAAILQHKPSPFTSLFDLVNCDINTELKATVMDAITALVSSRGDTADEAVAKTAVDNYDRVTFADPTLDVRENSRVPAPIGWVQRMEINEEEAGSYPLTRAYIRFLTALVPSTNSTVNNALRRGAMYVIDRVLLSKGRKYSQDNEHWELLDAVFAFIEKTLVNFDLTELLSPVRGTAALLAEQPGFLVLLRILSDPNCFTPMADVVDHVVNMSPPRAAIVDSVLLHVLRIYYRILDIQLVFSDVLLLTLASTSGFKRPLSFQSLDHYLLNRLSNIVSIALLVGDNNLAISLVSLKIVSALAESPLLSTTDIFRGEYSRAVNRLAGIIESSDESLRIAQAFYTRLEAEGEDLAPSEIDQEVKDVLSAKSDEVHPIVIRSNILDLLVTGTADSSGPNIAHFLLGFDFRARELGLQDPRAPNSRLSCLGVTLEQLSDQPPMIQLHPNLASKSAQLIYQLFANPITGPPTMSHCESYEAFPARQLATLPRTCPPVMRDVPGLGIASTYTDEVETSADVLVAFLDYEKFILSMTALQTFAFDARGSTSEFIAENLLSEDKEDEDDQRPPLLIDLVSAVDVKFTEADAGDATQNKVLEFFSGFNFDQYKRPGSEWYDVDLLGRALRAQGRHLARQSNLVPSSAQAMGREIDYILRRLSIKNRETEIDIAKGTFLTSWLEVLKVSLVMLFHNVPEDRQEVLLFELLDAILDRLGNDLAPGVLEVLCEAVLVAFTTLANVLSVFDSTNLPIDRLGATLLKVIDAAVKPGTTENARGNLYAAVSQYLQLVPDDPDHPLHKKTVFVLSARKDRFVAVVCRDAMDMRDVWKTECFSLLASIVSLGSPALTTPLTQGGYLIQFVRSIKDREMALQECLSPEPENLHAYWVYESKLNFLTAYASTAKGADDLVEAGVFEVFATCGFIAAQPFSDDVYSEVSAYETVERQHSALICALQLLVRILASPTRSGVQHALSFLHAHCESLVVLLREDAAYITVPGIDESRLIIALLSAVVPKVSQEDLSNPTAFGAYHYAVLGLAAKFFDNSWADNLHGDPEGSAAKALALNQIILSYLVKTTSGLKAGQGVPVLVTGVARAPAHGMPAASAPSVGETVELVAELAEAAQDVGAAYDDVAEKLASGEDAPRVDIPGIEGETVQELHDAFAVRLSMINNMIEEALLLIWRHMLYYASETSPVRPEGLSASWAASKALNATAGGTSGKALQRAAASLRGVLDRLDVVMERDGEDAYGKMLVRRLRELCASLVDQ